MADWSKLQNIWQDPMFQFGVGMLAANRGPSGGEALQNALAGGMQGVLRGQTMVSNVQRQQAATELAQQQQQKRAMQLEQQRRLAAAAPQFAQAFMSQDPQVRQQAIGGIAGMMPEALPGMLGQAMKAQLAPEPAPAAQEMEKDIAGRLRYVGGDKHGQLVFPDVPTPPPEPPAPPKPTEISGLRKEYTQVSKPWIGIRDAYEKLNASRDTPAGDISLVFAYMKILDPASTVREGEAATVEQARGVPSTILNLYNRIVKGEKLRPEQRQDFKEQGRALVLPQLQHQIGREEAYTQIAGRAGVNPSDVVRDIIGDTYRGMLSPSRPPQALPQNLPPLPPGAVLRGQQ